MNRGSAFSNSGRSCFFWRSEFECRELAITWVWNKPSFPQKKYPKYHRKLLNGETPTSCRNSQYVMVKKSWFPPLTFGISGPLRCGFPDDPSRSERQPRDRLPSQQFQPGRRCGQRLRGGSTGGSPVVTSHP